MYGISHATYAHDFRQQNLARHNKCFSLLFYVTGVARLGIQKCQHQVTASPEAPGRFPEGVPEGSLAQKAANVQLPRFRKVPEGFRKVSRKETCKRLFSLRSAPEGYRKHHRKVTDVNI